MSTPESSSAEISAGEYAETAVTQYSKKEPAATAADAISGITYIQDWGAFCLGFKNKEFEKEYFDQFLKYFGFRNNVGCFLTVVFIVGNWIVSDCCI